LPATSPIISPTFTTILNFLSLSSNAGSLPLPPSGDLLLNFLAYFIGDLNMEPRTLGDGWGLFRSLYFLILSSASSLVSPEYSWSLSWQHSRMSSSRLMIQSKGCGGSPCFSSLSR
jgi:hypothetical protein